MSKSHGYDFRNMTIEDVRKIGRIKGESPLHQISANGHSSVAEAAAAIEKARVLTPETLKAGIKGVIRQRRREPEHQEQCQVVQWCRDNQHCYPGLELLFAIPNGGQRSKATAGKLKAEGVRTGVCDLFLPVPMRHHYALPVYNGLFIEMKAEGGSVSSAQDLFMQAVRAQGYAAFVCYGANAAIETIRWYYGEVLGD